MSKFEYTDEEKKINKVLAHQKKELEELQNNTNSSVEDRIKSSETILKKLGYTLPEAVPSKSATCIEKKKEIIIPTWEDLLNTAEQDVQGEVVLEDLFTEEEININAAIIKRLNAEYNEIHRLDKYDVMIAALAGIVSGVVDILLVGIPEKTKDGLKAGPLSNYIRDYFDNKYCSKELEKLAESKVPYDAQDNRHTRINVEGLSAYYHRLLSLGHDPLLGFVIGVADILSGRMTTIDKAGHIASQAIDIYADRREANIFAALAKQILHFKSDINTSMGLPAPLMGLFNLLQFGSIGKENQTIAEIVQGMYYEGYDFIHFCSMAVTTMIVEVVVRMGYALKRIKEGSSVKDSIPVSLDREKHPKLATMLFIGHSASTAINTGKIAFTKNPMVINYPEWLAFAKYSYQQLKWVLIEKPRERDKYVNNIINNELLNVYDDIDQLLGSMDAEIVFNDERG